MNKEGLSEETGLKILGELQALNKFNADQLKASQEKEALQAEQEKQEALQATEKKKADEQALIQKQEEQKTKEAEQLEKENADKQALEDFRKNVLQEISVLSQKDDTKVLTNLDTNLKTVAESLENSAKGEELSSYTDIVIVFFLMIALPAFLAYKGLSKFFDTVTGV